jgi:hypothetical protein
MNDEVQRSVAVEELKILSSIIGRIESTIHQRLVWLLTLITGLALALLKEDPLISGGPFAVISILATVVFWLADGIQRVPVHRAIERSKRVEKSLRDNQGFNSPMITDSLSRGGVNWREFKDVAFRLRVISLYLATIVVVLIIWSISVFCLHLGG